MVWLVYLIFLAIVFILSTYAWAAFSFAPWVPCWSKDLARIFKFARLKEGEIFYDLGCGNGKTVIYAAKNFKAKAVGLELALPLYFFCQWRQLFNYRYDVTFRWKNLFKEDLAAADVIYFFGLPHIIRKRLKDKLERELKSGTRVISYTFAIPGWQPTCVDKPTIKDLPIYVYNR